MNKSGDILGYSTMESVRQRNDPDSENRLSLGGKNRSNRRSSILKTSKSPMKALEDRDPNSMESDKENRDMKSRRSSNRRVSFAQTYEVKEFSKDDGWSEWEKASISNTDKKIEKEEYLPSEYRPANVTIKGLESLLKGDIQNPERQQQAGSDMDFITFCTSAFNEPSQSDLNRTVGFSNDDTLDLTCHGQGVIDHENRAPNVTSNYDNMDFTVCQPKMYSDETADSTNRTEHTLDMTCHGHGVITSDDCYQGPKFCPSSFLQSLVVKPSQEFVPSTSISHTTAQQHQVTAQQPQKTDAASLSSTELPKQVASQQGSTNVPSRSFLESLVTSTPFNDDEEEEMEMTTCLEVPLETTNETMPDSSIVLEVGPQQPTLSSKPKQGRMFYETQMDMTSCVSSSMTPQGQSMAQVAQMDMPSIMTQTHSVAQGMGHVPLLARSLGNSQEAQMDMTTCLPSSTRTQGHSMAQDAHMDMTICVPSSMRTQGHSMAQEAHMDMTTCVPSSTRTQEHSMAQEAHMDMTTCVPSSTRTQEHSMAQEAHMDMTTCVPSSMRTQGHSMAQEAHMDMTTCVPSSMRTQGHSMAQEAHMDMTTCVPSSMRPQGHSMAQEAHMDMTTCVPSSTRTQGHSMTQEAHMDMTTCVPSSMRPQGHSMAQEAHMDMTTCVPSSTRTQGHSMAQEAHMDMTTCVPSSMRTQGHSMAQEAHMDMTTCVPSSTRTQGHSMAQEAHMDMTTCVPSSTRPNEHHPVKDAKMNTVAVVESPSRTHSKMPETQMDTSAYSLLVQEDQALPTTARDISQPSAQQSNNFEDKTTSSPANPLEDVEETSQCYQKINNKAWTRPSCMETVTNDPSDVMTQHNQPHSKSFHSFKEHFNQSLLSHTMPLLGSQKKKISSFQSLPALSSFILQTSEASSKEPQITFGPTCDVPISQFCSQTAKKQKITHDTQKTIAAEEASIDQPSNNHISENDSFIFSKQDKECSPDKTETVVHPDNITFPFESKETTVDVGKLSSVDTFVLEQQGLPQQIFQEPDGGANITSQFEREALEQQCDDVVVEQDGEVSFKSFSPDKDKTDNLNVTETLSHSSMVGLMDEPTLEFSSDVLDDTVEQPNNESKECNIPKSPENTFVLGKKPTNLSVICEENDADFSKNASFNGNQEESRVTRKKITVAELLKRANISFKCPILQGSRRSIFGIIKKPEKPKEEKEMIKLSLALKPQALHYSEFCSSVQKDIEQLKTKIKQQEQELDNSETPILYYTSEDEMTQLANKLKDLKRTVCKESANARWIERSGVMKKRLASVLKDNRDQLSSDVAAIKQSLALAKDCNNLLNNIDSELDKGILALRDKIEKANKESGNIDEVQSTIKQKTSELESQETELRLLEERRSYLISSKETLTSKRENVEKEKLEREARLAREESERLSQEELFQEKYNVLKGILEWELDEWDQQHAKFLFLRQTLELLVMFQTGGDRTTVSRPIKSISLSSCLADDSHISAKFAHSLIQKSLDMKTLAELSPTSCSLSKALDHVSSVVVNARMIGDELYNVSFNHAMTMNDTRVSIMFSSMKAFMKFFVELDVDATKHPDNVTITVKPKIGQLCCEDIMAALKAVSIGPKYITRLVDTGRLLFDKK